MSVDNPDRNSRFVLIPPPEKESIRRAALSLLELAREMIGFVEKEKWESPQGDRKLWRKKKQDGGYEYREDPPDDKENKPEIPVEKQKKFKLNIHLNSARLKATLDKGHFSIVSAGRNKDDPKEAKMEANDSYFRARHEQLRVELEKNGLPYTEVVGHYGGLEDSFLVFHDDTALTRSMSRAMMVHHRDEDEAKKHHAIIKELGKRFNQNSVLFGSAGKNSLFYTTGERKGKSCGGEGWKEAPEAKDYYTDINLKDKEHTKVQLDLKECADKGWL